MGQQVWTTKGLVDEDLLEVADHIERGDNYRKVVTVWTLKSTGEVVRQDVGGSILRGPEMAGVAGTLNGA